jgi:hypothetical protein
MDFVRNIYVGYITSFAVYVSILKIFLEVTQ